MQCCIFRTEDWVLFGKNSTVIRLMFTHANAINCLVTAMNFYLWSYSYSFLQFLNYMHTLDQGLMAKLFIELNFWCQHSYMYWFYIVTRYNKKQLIAHQNWNLITFSVDRFLIMEILNTYLQICYGLHRKWGYRLLIKHLHFPAISVFLLDWVTYLPVFKV